MQDAGSGASLDVPEPVHALVDELRDELRRTLGDAIEGIYLFGSLVEGGFEPERSDIDLLVALRADVDAGQLARLGRMHDAFARRHPAWADRIDACYLASAALRACKERQSPIVTISPGEPLHATRTVPGWLMNWHRVREAGVALAGPPARDLIAEITADDFLAAIRAYLPEMHARVEDPRHPAFPAYAVLTVCRGLYAVASGGRQASKARAARWAAARHPEWADAIAGALAVQDGRPPGPEGLPAWRRRAVAFVRFAVAEATRSERSA